MLTPDDVVADLQRRFDRRAGAWASGQEAVEFPWVVRLKAPREDTALANPEEVRRWISAWRGWRGPGVVDMQERQWARRGRQVLPVSVSFSSMQDLARVVGRAKPWAQATQRVSLLCERWPDLHGTDALRRHYEQWAAMPEADFARLVDLLSWLLLHPQSRLYVRQIPVPGLDTKWLERRMGLVDDLLACLAPSRAGESFFERAGLIRPAARIRMFVLCPRLRSMLGGLRDIEGPVDEVAALCWQPTRIVVVENLVTAIALPDIQGAVAFGKLGKAVGLLGEIPWVQNRPAVYWGDLDTHGFDILDTARLAIPAVASCLMDMRTLEAYRDLLVEEASPIVADLPRLTAVELEAYNALRGHDRFGRQPRLEQERIPLEVAIKALETTLESLVS